ncbi:uncharacterized protein EI90DRAFT_2502385 [Cantharellus anzutake]|uniref:uncharacterized protein n=1 Tax=Cantharellus anzutake TaxID=1750568 RepID=UPI0019052BBE|nr:uncharacterized protein EI90DRAFT_2502385 [Cantharellus anzutake]KAF8321468.1 hypothetical protein EI90DRAFT_2502385 [Cantharellus anzutake]
MCSIEPNPNVSGIGIRVSFYVTSTIISLLRFGRGYTELCDALAQGAGVNALALLIVAIVQTVSKKLDLFHALIISHINGYFGIILFVHPLYYRAPPKQLAFYWVTIWILQTVHSAWAVYLMVNAPRFGPDPECNDSVIYLMLAWKVRVTALWFRALGIAVIGVSNLAALYATPWIIKSIFRLLKGSLTRQAAHERDPSFELPYFSGINPHPTFDTPTTPYIDQHSSQNPGLQPTPQAVANADKVLHFCGALGRLIGTAYGVISLELTVHFNHVQPGENVWNFGQLVAVVILAGNTHQFVRFYLKKREEGVPPVTIMD